MTKVPSLNSSALWKYPSPRNPYVGSSIPVRGARRKVWSGKSILTNRSNCRGRDWLAPSITAPLAAVGAQETNPCTRS